VARALLATLQRFAHRRGRGEGGRRVKRRALVSFVGAGPGDPGLITLKGARRLREAAVVLHDRFVPSALLAEASSGAEVIDVGQAPGQSHINWLLVDRAARGERVVRLKSGDPSTFARLGEEIDAVRSARIPFEVIPGVTAAAAAAARVGISLTERRTAPTLVLAAGRDHAGEPGALDWDLLARVEGTLVFYMPLGALETITTSLTALGRDPREPAILVERAGAEGERVLAGRLGEIADAAQRAGLAAPAVLLTGPTVGAASVPLSVRCVSAGAGAPA
jgi:uroporphyrin-III C-methyltransferase